MLETGIESEPRLIVLTGAPLSSSLRWGDDGLSAPLQECFADTPNKQKPTLSSITISEPVWRSLSLDREHLPTGFTQLTRADDITVENNDPMDEDSFLTSMEFTHALSKEDSGQLSATTHLNDDIISQYYEHSYAIHEDASFAHAVDPDSDCENSLSTSFEECSISFETNATPTPKNQLIKTRLASSVLTELNHIPNASYLRSITPQTMTVNLVVGIISIPPPRIITTRRGGRNVELVEMLVGDNTAAGFRINIWLPSSENADRKASQSQDLQHAVSQLRPRDVILVRNIALSSYGGKVYGQSLMRNMTTMNLLYRDLFDVTDEQGAFGVHDLKRESVDNTQIAKVGKVRQWVMEFVGVGIYPQQARFDPNIKNSRGGQQEKPRLAELPPDTPQ